MSQGGENTIWAASGINSCRGTHSIAYDMIEVKKKGKEKVTVDDVAILEDSLGRSL